MSHTGDHVPEMPPTALLDDRAIDALIDGQPVAAWAEPLAVFAARVRAAGDGRPPRPSPALARLLARGLTPDATATATEPLALAVTEAVAVESGRPVNRRRLVATRVAGISLAAKVAIGATAAAAGVIGAGASGVLPGAPGRVVRDAIELVTPLEFHDDAPAGGDQGVSDGDTDDGVDEPGEHGDAVSSDATGETDGEPGVDGQDVADTAPGATNRPTDPGQSGTAGQPDDQGGAGEPSSTSVTLPPWAPGQPGAPRPPADPGSPPSTAPTDPDSQTTPSTDGTNAPGQ